MASQNKSIVGSYCLPGIFFCWGRGGGYEKPRNCGFRSALRPTLDISLVNPRSDWGMVMKSGLVIENLGHILSIAMGSPKSLRQQAWFSANIKYFIANRPSPYIWTHVALFPLKGTPCFLMVLLRLAAEVEPCLVYSGRMLQTIFCWIKSRDLHVKYTATIFSWLRVSSQIINFYSIFAFSLYGL